MKKDFNNAKIYKLIDNDGYYYIGCTCQSLFKRFYEHKNDSKRKSCRKVYQYFNSVGWENVKIILITDEVPIENIDQLRRLENDYIESSITDKKCLNGRHEIITTEQKKEYQKTYRMNHKKERKQYVETHKEQIKLCNDRYEQNNYHIRQKYQEKIKNTHYVCQICDYQMRKNELKRHEQSIKHQKNLALTI